MSLTASRPESDGFGTTQWTRVLAARTESPEARAALSDLCAAYYLPVHAYIARTTRDLGEARDLTHSFFERLLGGHMLAGVQPHQGRFRNYLLGAVKHFLADARDRQYAAKRGAHRPHLPLRLTSETSPGFDPADPTSLPPDAWFDRQWALTLVSRVLDSLAHEHRAAGKADHFAILSPWLTGDGSHFSQAEAAAQLGLSENALKVALHRLRRRFRDHLIREVSSTVDHPANASDELRALLHAL
ncbi:MAG: RNA polymerase sigma factor [Verrucomicrobiales bacterium]